VARCFQDQTSHLCLYSIQHSRMMSRYAGALAVQYCTSVSIPADPVTWSRDYTHPQADHRCVACGPVGLCMPGQTSSRLFSVQLSHCTGLFIVFLGHAASLCPLKVRGFTFVSTANRSIVAYDSAMATGTPLLKSVCLCCCRK
jgi:hypothetical protein